MRADVFSCIANDRYGSLRVWVFNSPRLYIFLIFRKEVITINDALFSTGNNNWGTPQYLFDQLNEEFHFTLDPCASKENAKCDRFYTEEENGLSKDWTGETVFCNPPYSDKQQDKWVKKCYEHAQNGGTAVMLIPARTDTKRFHDYIYGNAEIRFIKGRLKFGDSKSPAPFPSMIVVFRKKRKDILHMFRKEDSVMNFNGIKVFAHGLKTWVCKNSPVLLTGVGIAGLVTTAILASKATLKAHSIVLKELQKQDEELNGAVCYATASPTVKCGLTTMDRVKLTWKCFIPATIVGATSIACIIGGTVQNQKRIAALSALYSLSEQALKEYQESAKEISSKVTPDKVDEKTLERKLSQNPPTEGNVISTGHGDTLFFDSYCGRYFKSDIDFVKRVVNDCNYAVTHGDSVSLNEYYANLDLPLLTEWHGNQCGWNDRTIELSLTSKLTENDTACVCLDFKPDGRPMMLYEFY